MIIESLVNTSDDYIYLFIRAVSGIIIFPYGMRKAFGWFKNIDGPAGPGETVKQMKEKRIPAIMAWLVIIGQAGGSIALLLGCFARVAAFGNFLIFAGALIVHAPDGWTMNWSGKKKGEGIEYFVLLLALLLITIIKGSGALSIDLWLQSGL